MRTTFIFLSVLFAATLHAAERPNVIFILADDLGYGDLSCYGATKITTPNCDRLAREGRRFTDAHTPSAVCSPTRFGLMTGTYPWRESRVPRHLHASEPLVIRDGEPTVASLLKAAGYATGCVGKWHLGAQRQDPIDWNAPLAPGPNAAGFDYYFGVINSHNQAPFVLVENEKILGLQPGDRLAVEGQSVQSSGPKLRDENALESEQAAKAIAFIERNSRAERDSLPEAARRAGAEAPGNDRPFFLYYPTAAVHVPITPGKAWQGKSQAGPYGDYVQEFDWAVGEVLGALDRLKLADKTIVVVSSDNGALANSGVRFGHKPIGDLRGGKTTAWEGGHRVPFVVRWPGKVPAGTVSEETICHVDFMATICAALDVALPAHAGPDSWNVLPAWLGEKTNQPLREATVSVSQNASVLSIRQGPWKLLVNAVPGVRAGSTAPDLFNLNSDLAEKHNLAAAEPDKVKELAALLARYRQEGYSRPGWRAAAR